MGTLILITGGARSGKSSWALARANRSESEPKTFVATAELVDDEMRDRAQRHRRERGEGWRTVEEPRDLVSVIGGLTDGDVAVIDCCTVWLGTIWHECGGEREALDSRVDSLTAALKAWKRTKSGMVVVVSNEVGWGIVPSEPAVRRYRDAAGRLNRLVAAAADEVYLSVAGIAMKIKPAEGAV